MTVHDQSSRSSAEPVTQWTPASRTEPRTEQPGNEQPGNEQPGYQQPGNEQPGYQQPGNEWAGNQWTPPVGPAGPGAGGGGAARKRNPKLAIAGALAAVAVASAGVTAGVMAAAGSGSSTTTATGGPGAGFGRGAGGPGGAGGGLAAALHGTAVVSDGNGGYTTELTQTGTVSAVSSSSITVKSVDGYTKTYTIGSSTSVDNGSDQISSVATGNTVLIVADSKAQATTITDTELSAGSQTGQGGPAGGALPGQ